MKHERVIDVLYWNDSSIIGYKIAIRAWPHGLYFMLLYSLSVRMLFCLCHSLHLAPHHLFPRFSPGTTHHWHDCYQKKICLIHHLINMREINEFSHVWKWFDFHTAFEMDDNSIVLAAFFLQKTHRRYSGHMIGVF